MDYLHKGLFHFDKINLAGEGHGKSFTSHFPFHTWNAEEKVYLTFFKRLTFEIFSFYVNHTDVPSLLLQRQVCVCSLVIIITGFSGWKKGNLGLNFIVLSVKLWPEAGLQQGYFTCLKTATFRLATIPRNYKTAAFQDTKLWKHPYLEMVHFSKEIRNITMQVSRDSFENSSLKNFFSHEIHEN